MLCGLQLQAQSLEIETLSDENTIVRIAPAQDSRYLLLPIEEKAPESRIGSPAKFRV